MSQNSSTYMKLVEDTLTIDGTGVGRFETSAKYVHALLIGVDGSSASASTGNYVGGSAVTLANGAGQKITAGSSYSAAAIPNDRGTIPVNIADYYVAGTSGDTLWCQYFEETQKGN